MSRGKMRSRVGIVAGNKMDKTVVVEVESYVRHPRYKKPVKRTSRFKAHDERNECQVGDKVLIIETRRLSKTKSWRVSKILERAVLPEVEAREEVMGEGGEKG